MTFACVYSCLTLLNIFVGILKLQRQKSFSFYKESYFKLIMYYGFSVENMYQRMKRYIERIRSLPAHSPFKMVIIIFHIEIGANALLLRRKAVCVNY